MKKITQIKVLSLIGIMLFLGITKELKAQDDAKAQCKMKQSLYGEFYKQKNYKDAYESWMYVFKTCPDLSKATYAHGVKIVKAKLKEFKKDKEVAQKYIDTLIMVYDQRIKYFPNDKKYPEAWILGRKGNDLFRLRKRTNLKDAYDCVEKSITAMGPKTEASVVGTFWNATLLLNKKGEMDCEKLVSNFLLSTETLDAIILVAKEKKKAKLRELRVSIDDQFAKSKCSSCEAIIPIYTKKIEASPEDVDLLKQSTALLTKKKCTDSELFETASVKLYDLLKATNEITYDAAYNLAQLFAKKENYTKSADYYLEAINLLTDDDTLKAKYYSDLSIVKLQLKQYSQVRQYALASLKLNKKNGKPYIAIGLAYASSSKNVGKDSYEHSAVYWAAVDKFYTAKAVDPSVSAEANKYINTYKKFFPGKEEMFMRGDIGKEFTVGGWINETTKAREK